MCPSFIGSSRVITQSNGTLCSDADFLPFGQEVDYTSGCAQNYKFEGKERDIETGNDNFGARYYRSALGRWMSPDWSAIPAPVPYANLTNPATLNLYAMTTDNPETFADLDGHLGGIPEAIATNPNGFGEDMEVDSGWYEDKDGNIVFSGSAPPDPTPQQPIRTPQNPTEAQEQGTPARVVRTGEETDSKPTKMTNGACPNGCIFEGKIYSYQVVDAKGKPVTSSMTVTEHLKRIKGRMGKPATALAPAGNFKDVVGRKAPFGPEKSVTDQTFTVKIGNQVYNLSTKIRQTVVVDDRGHVSVSESILVP